MCAVVLTNGFVIGLVIVDDYHWHVRADIVLFSQRTRRDISVFDPKVLNLELKPILHLMYVLS